MKEKHIIFTMLCILVLSCTAKKKEQKSNTYYIYDSKNKFKAKEYANKKGRLFYTYQVPSYILYIYENDTIFEKVSTYSFMLVHYSDYGDDHYNDTCYIKHKSFLSKIKYYDYKWLSNNNNLLDFWKGKEYYYFSFNKDSANVFLIQNKKGTDSLIIQRVHRATHPPREGSIIK